MHIAAFLYNYLPDMISAVLDESLHAINNQLDNIKNAENCADFLKQFLTFVSLTQVLRHDRSW